MINTLQRMKAMSKHMEKILFKMKRVDRTPDNNETDNPNQPCENTEQQDNNGLGVWLWYIEGTGYTHLSVAERLGEIGVDLIYINVALGEYLLE